MNDEELIKLFIDFCETTMDHTPEFNDGAPVSPHYKSMLIGFAGGLVAAGVSVGMSDDMCKVGGEHDWRGHIDERFNNCEMCVKCHDIRAKG